MGTPRHYIGLLNESPLVVFAITSNLWSDAQVMPSSGEKDVIRERKEYWSSECLVPKQELLVRQ